jgi:hypothetical protein
LQILGSYFFAVSILYFWNCWLIGHEPHTATDSSLSDSKDVETLIRVLQQCSLSSWQLPKICAIWGSKPKHHHVIIQRGLHRRQYINASQGLKLYQHTLQWLWTPQWNLALQHTYHAYHALQHASSILQI